MFFITISSTSWNLLYKNPASAAQNKTSVLINEIGFINIIFQFMLK